MFIKYLFWKVIKHHKKYDDTYDKIKFECAYIFIIIDMHWKIPVKFYYKMLNILSLGN